MMKTYLVSVHGSHLQWTGPEWLRAYQSTDNRSESLSYAYLQVNDPPANVVDRSRDGNDETAVKTVTFDDHQTSPKTVNTPDRPNSLNLMSTSTDSPVTLPTSSRAPTAMATAPAPVMATESPSPTHRPRPLPSLPHTLRSENATQSVYSQLDFRTNVDNDLPSPKDGECLSI